MVLESEKARIFQGVAHRPHEALTGRSAMKVIFEIDYRNGLVRHGAVIVRENNQDKAESPGITGTLPVFPQSEASPTGLRFSSTIFNTSWCCSQPMARRPSMAIPW